MGFLELTETFVSVADSRSITSAAEQLGISVSATSRQLNQLESELDRALLLRGPHGATLTPAGQSFLPYARALIENAQAARQALGEEEQVAGELTIGASVTWGLVRLTHQLPLIRARAPNVKLTLRIDDEATNLVSDGVDIVVRSGLALPDSTAYHARKLESVSRVLVGSPDLLRGHAALNTVQDLATIPALASGPSTKARTWRLVGPEGALAEVIVDGPLRARTLLARKQASLMGFGLTILPRFLCEAELRSGSLVEILPHWRPEPAEVFALYRVELKNDPKLRIVLSALAADRGQTPEDTR